MYLKRDDVITAKTLFSKCFTDGTVFYTCLIGETAISGFLRPEDTFDVSKVRLKLWRSFNRDGLEFSNVGFEVKNHEKYHNKEVSRLLEKKGTFCPSRLRRFRDFSFFE